MTMAKTMEFRAAARFNPVFRQVNEWRGRYRILKGSAGSGKSVNIAQDYIAKLSDPIYAGANLLVVRKVEETNRDSTFAELQAAIYRMFGPYAGRFWKINLNPLTGEHSPAVFSITAMGDLPPGLGLTRAGAKPGDDIWVSGTLGDAYAALKYRWGHWAAAPEAVRLMSRRMDRPEPRNALGRALLPLATAAIDVSDGFSQDLTHILERSHVRARVSWDDVPRSEALMSLPEEEQREAALSGGDDYELIFTAPPSLRKAVFEAGIAADTLVTRVGEILPSDGDGTSLTVYDAKGAAVILKNGGFDHFA